MTYYLEKDNIIPVITKGLIDAAMYGTYRLASDLSIKSWHRARSHRLNSFEYLRSNEGEEDIFLFPVDSTILLLLPVNKSTTLETWKNLSIQEKSKIIKAAVSSGITNRDDTEKYYDEYISSLKDNNEDF